MASVAPAAVEEAAGGSSADFERQGSASAEQLLGALASEEMSRSGSKSSTDSESPMSPKNALEAAESLERQRPVIAQVRGSHALQRFCGARLARLV